MLSIRNGEWELYGETRVILFDFVDNKNASKRGIKSYLSMKWLWFQPLMENYPFDLKLEKKKGSLGKLHEISHGFK